MDSRFDLLNLLCKRFDPCSYLEIGCAADDCFRWIEADNKVGVDPIRGGTHRMTSDDFFEGYQDTFDVVFIDGLHLKEQAERDFDNSLQRLNHGGFIAIHDALPPSFESTDPAIMESALARGEPVDSVGIWCGEVWRVLVKLLARKDLDMVLWPEDFGCVVVRPGLTKSVKATAKNYEEWMAGYPKWMNLVKDRVELEAWLGS